MASISMAASFLPATTKFPPSTNARRSVVQVRASCEKAYSESKAHEDLKVESRSAGRRDLVFAAATAAALTVARVAMADDEPKPGTEEAKKKYAPICVTMPTARVCRK